MVHSMLDKSKKLDLDNCKDKINEKKGLTRKERRKRKQNKKDDTTKSYTSPSTETSSGDEKLQNKDVELERCNEEISSKDSYRKGAIANNEADNWVIETDASKNESLCVKWDAKEDNCIADKVTDKNDSLNTGVPTDKDTQDNWISDKNDVLSENTVKDANIGVPINPEEEEMSKLEKGIDKSEDEVVENYVRHEGSSEAKAAEKCINTDYKGKKPETGESENDMLHDQIVADSLSECNLQHVNITTARDLTTCIDRPAKDDQTVDNIEVFKKETSKDEEIDANGKQQVQNVVQDKKETTKDEELGANDEQQVQSVVQDKKSTHKDDELVANKCKDDTKEEVEDTSGAKTCEKNERHEEEKTAIKIDETMMSEAKACFLEQKIEKESLKTSTNHIDDNDTIVTDSVTLNDVENEKKDEDDDSDNDMYDPQEIEDRNYKHYLENEYESSSELSKELAQIIQEESKKGEYGRTIQELYKEAYETFLYDNLAFCRKQLEEEEAQKRAGIKIPEKGRDELQADAFEEFERSRIAMRSKIKEKMLREATKACDEKICTSNALKADDTKVLEENVKPVPENSIVNVPQNTSEAQNVGSFTVGCKNAHCNTQQTANESQNINNGNTNTKETFDTIDGKNKGIDLSNDLNDKPLPDKNLVNDRLEHNTNDGSVFVVSEQAMLQKELDKTTCSDIEGDLEQGKSNKAETLVFNEDVNAVDNNPNITTTDTVTECIAINTHFLDNSDTKQNEKSHVLEKKTEVQQYNETKEESVEANRFKNMQRVKPQSKSTIQNINEAVENARKKVYKPIISSELEQQLNKRRERIQNHENYARTNQRTHISKFNSDNHQEAKSEAQKTIVFVKDRIEHNENVYNQKQITPETKRCENLSKSIDCVKAITEEAVCNVNKVDLSCKERIKVSLIQCQRNVFIEEEEQPVEKLDEIEKLALQQKLSIRKKVERRKALVKRHSTNIALSNFPSSVDVRYIDTKKEEPKKSKFKSFFELFYKKADKNQ